MISSWSRDVQNMRSALSFALHKCCSCKGKEWKIAASSRCRQNLKYENFTTSFGRQRQNIAPKSVPHVQHDYFSSFNQASHWFVTLSWSLPSSFVKLPFISSTRHLAPSRSQDMEFACGCYRFYNPNYSTPACQEPTVCLLPIMSNCLWFLAKDYFYMVCLEASFTRGLHYPIYQFQRSSQHRQKKTSTK